MNPSIKVIGAGGSGSNTISRIAKFNGKGVELIAINTDAQALHFCRSENKILIGKNTTRGLGAGMDVNLGQLAAEESKEEIAEGLRGADMVFITCGLGGGTGSGASPVIAEISKNMGCLTIAVVTMPFSFEGEQRQKIAKSALENLKDKVDSILVISNDNLLKIIDEKTTVSNAFILCDEILHQAVGGITDLILVPGIINIDFASVVSVLKNSGRALFGVGRAAGENRAVEAAEKAINSPLLDFSIKGAKSVLFSAFGNDITLNEISKSAETITKNVDLKAKIIFGAVKDNNLKKGEIKISVIATNF
ncbi:MAG: cell division protein FtsZ [Candidatus Staskawiczbacteria bacterium RIFCSPLOWO2_01_FULL_37_25b]|uniref:Cell division protein FtsZ n=2 Tax=Candidatus Staskawicziibacteriota TaxID=1817916 RepID=A0A1G2HNC3_9BACT|nr:MAG: cell division protein FtsZ [Candidatus Staskawiczbacteria bacterium RIFCSPHIGHO2_01_FULL_36_16]OGZ74167.1 MAG: cell division protein FtsZ [Candidatus Staskawiczbacteria bacterium RIFCSPLOWO2_01_FULL_37_25b]